MAREAVEEEQIRLAGVAAHPLWGKKRSEVARLPGYKDAAPTTANGRKADIYPRFKVDPACEDFLTAVAFPNLRPIPLIVA